jgi:uncharacterized protein YecE (DUF72 family)
LDHSIPPISSRGQFIQAYARRFRAVEIDSTYYSIPPRSMVTGWREKTPPGFSFAVKVPGVITHEKDLHYCQSEFTTFLSNIELLGDRLGPLLLQFPLTKMLSRPANRSRNCCDRS